MSINHMIQPSEGHMIQYNVTPSNEDHTISPSEESEHPGQCKGLLMLSQYDSDDSELEPGEVA